MSFDIKNCTIQEVSPKALAEAIQTGATLSATLSCSIYDMNEQTGKLTADVPITALPLVREAIAFPTASLTALTAIIPNEITIEATPTPTPSPTSPPTLALADTNALPSSPLSTTALTIADRAIQSLPANATHEEILAAVEQAYADDDDRVGNAMKTPVSTAPSEKLVKNEGIGRYDPDIPDDEVEDELEAEDEDASPDSPPTKPKPSIDLIPLIKSITTPNDGKKPAIPATDTENSEQCKPTTVHTTSPHAFPFETIAAVDGGLFTPTVTESAAKTAAAHTV